MRASPKLIDQWRQDQFAAYTELLREFQFDVPQSRHQDVLAQDEARLNHILTHGLDIGTIVEHIVEVALVKDSTYGWVFERENGEMFPVQTYIR